MKASVLIIDDDRAFRFAMARELRRLGCRICEADSTETASQLLRDENDTPDIVVLDLRLGGTDGLEFLRRNVHLRARFIVLTAHGSIRNAVDAMKLGAFSFLEKPVDVDALMPLLEQIKGAQRGGGDRTNDAVPPLVGESNGMSTVRRLVERVGPTSDVVMISGETGCGKEIVAHHVHLSSRRRNKPFIAFNAAAISSKLLESQLFGHRRGAFTGAVEQHDGLFLDADGGTLFIDEVGELSLDCQAKFLRAVETKVIRPVGASADLRVDVRIIAATNRNLWREVQLGRFREDLFFRLQVFPIFIPPLRSRVEDILPFAEHFLRRLCSECSISREGESVLRAYRWPGNVRELSNVLRRATLFSDGDVLDAELIRRAIASCLPVHDDDTEREVQQERTTLALAKASLAEVEKSHIEAVLHRFGGNRTKAATALGINLRTLQRKISSGKIHFFDDPEAKF